MKRKEQNIKKKIYNNGITLIALVITIIVLLILAGVTIATLTGENGILGKAEEARNQTEEGALEEEVRIKITEKETDKYLGEERGLIEYLNKIQDATVEEMGTGDSYYVKRGNAAVTVYEDGEIIEGKVDIWDGTSSEVPEIKEFEWYIYNCNQLKFFADCVNNGGVLTEEQKTMVAEKGYAQDISITEETIVYLMADLDLGARQEEGTLTRGTAWTPIGKTSIFNGIFEGNNYSIRGVYVSQTENFAGFFGKAKNLKNITIKNSYILGGNCMGGLVGLGYNIENCHNENTTVIQQEGQYYAIGGVVGEVDRSIRDCSNTGTVIGNGVHSTYGSRVGGIIGQTISSYSVTVDNCTNSGQVTGKGNYIGGIIANSLKTAIINNCMNSGKVTGNTGYVGGIIARAGTSSLINNCYNEGEVTGKETKEAHVGGIVGYNLGNVTNSYNKGKVTGEGNRVGGVVGEVDPETIVDNCYNEGEVNGKGVACRRSCRNCI